MSPNFHVLKVMVPRVLLLVAVELLGGKPRERSLIHGKFALGGGCPEDVVIKA